MFGPTQPSPTGYMPPQAPGAGDGQFAQLAQALLGLKVARQRGALMNGGFTGGPPGVADLASLNQQPMGSPLGMPAGLPPALQNLTPEQIQQIMMMGLQSQVG